MRWGDARTVRLAVGLFSDPPPLARMLADLSSMSFERQHLCLIGTSVAVDRWPRLPDEIAGQSRLNGLFDEVERLSGLIDGKECVASRGPLISDLRAPGHGFRAASGGLGWLSEKQHLRLSDHLLSGGLMLIVNSATSAEQDTSCRLLLRHSRRGVQTHDFTLKAEELV